jgi:hypothetical protein
VVEREIESDPIEIQRLHYDRSDLIVVRIRNPRQWPAPGLVKVDVQGRKWIDELGCSVVKLSEDGEVKRLANCCLLFIHDNQPEFKLLVTLFVTRTITS